MPEDWLLPSMRKRPWAVGDRSATLR